MQHIRQAAGQRQHAAQIAETPAPAADLAHGFGPRQLGQEGRGQRLAIRVEGVGDDDEHHRQQHAAGTHQRHRCSGDDATRRGPDQQLFLRAMQVGPRAQAGHGEHDDGVGNGQRHRPRQRRPVGPARHAAHEVGRKHRRDDHGGVARVGEVVHRPAEQLAPLHAGVQHVGREQGHAARLQPAPSAGQRAA